MIDQAVRILAVVLDETITVWIAIAVDPPQRRLHMGPQRSYRREISRALEVFAGQEDEQRCRVDAAVVPAEWNFAEARHLAVAHLVQDLSRLGVPLGIHLRRLGCRQEPEHSSGDRRINPQSE